MEIEEEEEEEDLDFVPFLREETPSDASSGLTSENETSSTKTDKTLTPSLSQQKDTNNNNNNDDALNALSTSQLNQNQNRETLGNDEEEDAICKRTRARFSLANYTLDELETFLQESDNDGEGQNVDEQEEYRKFLAAVLAEGSDMQPHQDYTNPDPDEDENDVDFEAEIEEALESDTDDHGGLVPETRQKKRLKESRLNEKNRFIPIYQSQSQTKIPLRPILPCVPLVSQVQVAATAYPDSVYGFTAQQMGQLYVLIQEHVQLLVQVYSVSVMDPVRQKVAAESQKLIGEMVTRREEVLAVRKVAHPGVCFGDLYLNSSVNNTSLNQWLPAVDQPIFSVLDVAPLRLAKSYLKDVLATVIKHRQSHLANMSSKIHSKKEPLFPLPLTNPRNTNDERCKKTGPTRKSLAATLVESTKKQSVAPVPADIARLAQRFLTLFNPELFPHKPPVLAVTNRLLFTDSEDGLLAMGLMEYNTDWGAIQKHFLPCKSKHQIFVRQKNRSSSKAPENPIKAVRRMKMSPLTTDEQARIYEALKIFKHDWIAVWRYVVPHRDPTLLPRQWRIATGTQKSYSKSEAVKEKRRVYEAKRRREKALMADANGEEEANSDGANCGYDEMETNNNEEEAYVHEAFLADAENGDSNSNSTVIPPPNSSKDFSNSNANPSPSFAPRSTPKFPPVPLTPRSRNKGTRVVKLAPDLPPVNLPPSVRVISQSAFNATRNVPKEATPSTINPPRQLNLFPDNGGNGNNNGNGVIPAESDFLMHPLLFQSTTNEQQFRAYSQVRSYNEMNDVSRSHDFPRFYNEAPDDLQTIDFHPLLHRNESCSNGTMVEVLQRDNRENNLDLDIRLYSSLDGIGNRDASGDYRYIESGNTYSLEQGIADKGIETGIAGDKQLVVENDNNNSNYTNSSSSNNNNNVGNKYNNVNNNNNNNNNNNIYNNEDSIQGIVMEQEELSDSDEDSENVQFEQEEMIDSDDEQLQRNQNMDLIQTHNLLQEQISNPLCTEKRESNRAKKKRERTTKGQNASNRSESRSRKARTNSTKSPPDHNNKTVLAPRKSRKRLAVN